MDGRDALAKAKEYRPDLIILDLGMPVMNGLETARELFKHGIVVFGIVASDVPHL